jgi:RNA polymerase sigma-70 factor (ECF subfamily)
MDTDIALASRLARNLDAAFPALVAAHADRLYTIALRSLGDPRDAEEVAQDTLVRAYRAISTYPAERIAGLRLRPWLAAITINLVRNRRRNLADRFPPATLDGLVEGGYDPADSGAGRPEVVAERRAGSGEMARLLLQLPPYLRLAVVLRHVDGLSVAETAAVLGRPEGTIKAQVARGLDRLRQLVTAPPSATEGRADHGRERVPMEPSRPTVRSQFAGRTAAAAEVLR